MCIYYSYFAMHYGPWIQRYQLVLLVDITLLRAENKQTSTYIPYLYLHHVSEIKNYYVYVTSFNNYVASVGSGIPTGKSWPSMLLCRSGGQ